MVGIILIFHNNENNLNFDLITQTLNAASELHFCLVNNGSLDNTLALLNDVKQQSKNHISILDIKKYKSENFALKSAVRYLNSVEKIVHYGYLAIENDSCFKAVNTLIHANNTLPIKLKLPGLLNPKESRLLIKNVFLLRDYLNLILNNELQINLHSL
ncbi:hypothetical protein ACFQ0I_06010 [Mariniflexile aquimaris]|uniref:Glycosyl transferase family 2 n=1 Tax=Mariniflexile aquimaris TaxID=881009 RepID=A0ABW3BRW3_9FLAO